jgi:serine protease
VASDGTQSNDESYYPSISADGRFVAFGSSASNLVPGDTNGQPDVFVHDRFLVAGVSKSGSVVQGRWVYYQIDDSDSITDIKVELTNLSTDVDLYVNEGSLPTLTSYDCRPYKRGTTAETCTLTNPGATTWYIGVYGYTAGSFTIKATLSGGPRPLEPGVSQTGSVSLRQWKYYQIEASASDAQLKVELTNLSADVDLYVNEGSLPTLTSYDCRPYKRGTTAETCTLTNPGATTWYIGVYGYKAGRFAIKATLQCRQPDCPG